MASLQRRGQRRHVATFWRHNGTTDDHGMPTVYNDADWYQLNRRYPCEMLTVSGNETVRGLQVTAQTRVVLIGDYQATRKLTSTDRVVVNGQTLNIVVARDPNGLGRDAMIECKTES